MLLLPRQDKRPDSMNVSHTQQNLEESAVLDAGQGPREACCPGMCITQQVLPDGLILCFALW